VTERNPFAHLTLEERERCHLCRHARVLHVERPDGTHYCWTRHHEADWWCECRGFREQPTELGELPT
jgi:hypothetical protein